MLCILAIMPKLMVTSFRGEDSHLLAWKTANIRRRYERFSRQMTFEKRAQKFHADDASLPRSG